MEGLPEPARGEEGHERDGKGLGQALFTAFSLVGGGQAYGSALMRTLGVKCRGERPCEYA